jgi:competence protein ComEC
LLAWNPYTLRDPGFQLSVAAVAAIFVAARPLRRLLDGYPVPGPLADVVAVSTVCGVATAPISWLEFHRIPLLTIPANALAAPVVAPLLAIALLAAVVAPMAPSAATALASANGWCAAYLAGCARLFGSLPGAQVTSTRGAAGVAAAALAVGSYAWRRARRPEARLPAHGERSPEDQDGPRPAAAAFRR